MALRGPGGVLEEGERSKQMAPGSRAKTASATSLGAASKPPLPLCSSVPAQRGCGYRLGLAQVLAKATASRHATQREREKREKTRPELGGKRSSLSPLINIERVSDGILLSG